MVTGESGAGRPRAGRRRCWPAPSSSRARRRPWSTAIGRADDAGRHLDPRRPAQRPPEPADPAARPGGAGHRGHRRRAPASLLGVAALALGPRRHRGVPVRRRRRRGAGAGGPAADRHALAGPRRAADGRRSTRWCAGSTPSRRWARRPSSAPTRPGTLTQNRMTVVEVVDAARRGRRQRAPATSPGRRARRPPAAAAPARRVAAAAAPASPAGRSERDGVGRRRRPDGGGAALPGPAVRRRPSRRGRRRRGGPVRHRRPADELGPGRRRGRRSSAHPRRVLARCADDCRRRPRRACGGWRRAGRGCSPSPRRAWPPTADRRTSERDLELPRPRSAWRTRRAPDVADALAACRTAEHPGRHGHR